VDADAGNFNLRVGSPAIDVGTAKDELEALLQIPQAVKEGKADANRAPDRTADAGLSEVGVEDQAGGGRVGEGTAAGSNGAEEPLTKEQAALKFIEEAPAEFFESGKSLTDNLKGFPAKTSCRQALGFQAGRVCQSSVGRRSIAGL
jgi:hypothetical protein